MSEPANSIPESSGVNLSKSIHKDDTGYLKNDSLLVLGASLHDDTYTESGNEPLIKVIPASTGNTTEEDVAFDNFGKSFKHIVFWLILK